MSDTDKPAAPVAGVPQADHDRAVASARNEGEQAGAASATTRLSTVLRAEGIAGNAGRMSAALDLAIQSPGMSAEDVTKFVTAHTPEKSGSAASLANREQHSALTGQNDQPAADRAASTVNNMRKLLGQ